MYESLFLLLEIIELTHCDNSAIVNFFIVGRNMEIYLTTRSVGGRKRQKYKSEESAINIVLQEPLKFIAVSFNYRFLFHVFMNCFNMNG